MRNLIKEIVEYVEQTVQGRCRCMKRKNIKSLLNCAKVNNKFTQEQVDYIIKTYCREKNK